MSLWALVVGIGCTGPPTLLSIPIYSTGKGKCRGNVLAGPLEGSNDATLNISTRYGPGR